MSIKKITFVWNADFSVAGGVNALKELVEGEHSCTLCEIAYHTVTQTQEWKAYRKELALRYGAEIRQPCRNQLSQAERDAAEDDYPAVLAHTDSGIMRLISGEEIDECAGSFSMFRERLEAALVLVDDVVSVGA